MLNLKDAFKALSFEDKTKHNFTAVVWYTRDGKKINYKFHLEPLTVSEAIATEIHIKNKLQSIEGTRNVDVAVVYD